MPESPKTIDEWNRLLRPFGAPITGRSLLQLGLSLTLLFGGLAGTLTVDTVAGYWAALPLAAVSGLMLVRIFIIQHDCGHYSFFRQRWACDWVGRCLGVLTLTPYIWWKRDHDRHHATFGDLSRRGHGDITTITVREYRMLSFWGRLGYRLYRHPLVLFGIGPLYQFVVRQRLPIGVYGRNRQAIRSVIGTNLVVTALFVAGGCLFGFGRLAALGAVVLAVAATVGLWMFFIQHQFERTYWADHQRWSFVKAAIDGCSYYKLPRIVEWLTGSIGYHHIHHLGARIPNYRLRECFHAIPALQNVATLTFRDSLRCSKLALWCEERQRLLSFRDALA